MHTSVTSWSSSTFQVTLMFLFSNLRTAFREPYTPEGIYMVDPLADRTSSKKPKQPLKVMSVEGLKRALRLVINTIAYTYQVNHCRH